MPPLLASSLVPARWRDESGGIRPAFPHARYLVRRDEWEDATHPHERNRASYLQDDFVPLKAAGVLDLFQVDHNRCVLCSRCVRVCDEIEGAHTWDITGRGTDARVIYVTPGYQMIALDAKTGHRVATFGLDGIVDLKLGVVRGADSSVEELVDTARRCEVAGASLIHLHIRDDEHKPTLDLGRLTALGAKALVVAELAVLGYVLLSSRVRQTFLEFPAA